MDWIEGLLGISPDGGDGTTETMIVFASFAVLATIIYVRVPGLRERIRHVLGAFKIRP